MEIAIKTKRAVGYVRVSSDQQADNNTSIPSQIRLLTEYAARNEYELVGFYKDEAQSAQSDDRDDFQRMVVDAKSKLFDTILVWKFSRFARNRYDSIFYKRQLERLGVNIISISEPVDDSPTGKLMEGIIESMDEFYSRNLSVETRRGMIENARQGFANGGKAPYGYYRQQVDGKANKKRLQVQPDEAEVVRLMFQLYLDGHGIKGISRKLNDKGIKTRTDKTWSKIYVSAILRNRVYLGWTIFNRKSRDRHRCRPQEEWTITKGTHEPIIREQDFREVQERLDASVKANSNHNRSKYLLSGLLNCGVCGSAYAVGGYGKNKAYAYVCCITQTKKGSCTNRHVRLDKLEENVIRILKEKILTRENLKETMVELNQFAETYANKGNLLRLQDELREINEKEKHYFQMIETGKLDVDNVNDRLKDLKIRKESLQAQARDMENTKPRTYTMDDCLKLRDDVLMALGDGSMTDKKDALRRVIDRIMIYPDRFELWWKY